MSPDPRLTAPGSPPGATHEACLMQICVPAEIESTRRSSPAGVAVQTELML